jgi:serine/threonine-protein phosphatase 6 regulatory subunit 3
MGRLIEMLSPSHPSDMHTVVAEVIKGIISLAAPSPGTGLTEGLQNGPASNRFARELAHRDSVLKLADYMLYDFDSAGPVSHDQDSCRSPSETSPPPNLQSCTSSVIHSISIIIELIRKNNSDYFEPYLFHTLRNRLIQVQQHLQTHTEDGRETLEQAMKEMVDRMGVVHLGGVLNIISEKLDSFQRYLRRPRSLVRIIHFSHSFLDSAH